MRTLAYPLVVGACTVGAAIALERGLPVSPLVIALALAAAFLVFLLERVFPYRVEWNRSHGDLVTDTVYFLVAGPIRGIGPLAASLPFLYLASPLGSWPGSWPLLLQLPPALVLAELGVYALHRFEHASWAFRFHAVHHSAPRLWFANAARNHPLETLAYPIVSLGPLVALGASEKLVALVLVFQGTHQLFQHSNFDARLGPLNWILSAPEVHRWHHSRVLGEANANYGQTLLVWDLVFGTRAVPAGREPPADTGLADMPRFPQGLIGQLVAPFRWRALSEPPLTLTLTEPRS